MVWGHTIAAGIVAATVVGSAHTILAGIVAATVVWSTHTIAAGIVVATVMDVHSAVPQSASGELRPTASRRTIHGGKVRTDS